jgi:hypothetical protein
MDFRYGILDKYLIPQKDPMTQEMYGLHGVFDANNFYVNKFNGVSRRNGTSFFAQAKTNNVRIFPFIIGLYESYFIELGQNYLRIYSNNGIEKDNANNVYEFVTDFVYDDIKDFKYSNFVYAGSILYIIHKKYGYYELIRERKTGYNIWTFQKMKFKLQLDSFNKPIYSGTPTTTSKWQQATGSRMELILETLADDTFTGSTTNGLNKITTSVNYFTSDMVGSFVSGSGIPANSCIVSIIDQKNVFISNKATLTNTVTITRKKNIITSNNQGNYNFITGVIYKLIYIGATGVNNNQMRVVYIKTTSSGNTAYYQIVGGSITEAGDETGVPKATPIPLWEIEDGYDDSGFASGGCISSQRLMLIGPGLKGSRLAEYSDFGIYEESISQTSPVSVYPFKTSDNKFNSILPIDDVIYGFTSDELYRFVKSSSSSDTSINFSSARIGMKYGCSELTPLSINSFLLYLDRSKNKLNVGYYESQKEMLYTDEITKTNTSILGGNIKTYIYQI